LFSYGNVAKWIRVRATIPLPITHNKMAPPSSCTRSPPAYIAAPYSDNPRFLTTETSSIPKENISHPREYHELLPPQSTLKRPTPDYSPPFENVSTGYSRDINEFDPPTEEYQLLDRQRGGRFNRMDLELQRMKDRDVALKRQIRRFRFVVRAAHLACRYITSRD
jgi:hypothetical protein